MISSITVSGLLEKTGAFSKKLFDETNYDEIGEKLGVFRKKKSDEITYYDLMKKMGLLEEEVGDLSLYSELLMRAGVARRSLDSFVSYSEIQKSLFDLKRKGKVIKMGDYAVLGAGSMATAVSFLMASNGHEVLMWARRKEVADVINKKRIK